MPSLSNYQNVLLRNFVDIGNRFDWTAFHTRQQQQQWVVEDAESRSSSNKESCRTTIAAHKTNRTRPGQSVAGRPHRTSKSTRNCSCSWQCASLHLHASRRYGSMCKLSMRMRLGIADRAQWFYVACARLQLHFTAALLISECGVKAKANSAQRLWVKGGAGEQL